MTRALIGKTLGLAVFRRDFKARTVGPVEAIVRVDTKDWAALDDFYKAHGTALVRENVHGIQLIRNPEGWDHICVGMVNHFDDGTSEGAFTDEDAWEVARTLMKPKAG